MQSLEKLQRRYEREMEASILHKQTADELKKKIDSYQADILQRTIRELRMNGEEYDQLIEMLSAGKESVLDAAKLIMEKRKDTTHRRDNKNAEQEAKTE